MPVAQHTQVRGAGPLARACAISLSLVSTALAAAPQAGQPTVAYEDPAAAGQPDAAVGILTWGPGINVVSIDGSAPDPTAADQRARLAPGPHAIYYFGTVPGSSACNRPRTGDDLAEVELEAGRRYSILARGGQQCEMLLEMQEYGGHGRRVAGPDPDLWPSERLARVSQMATDRMRAELRRVAGAAASGEMDAAVDLALWYLLGDEPLPSADPVAAQAWLLFASERGAARAESMRARLEPSLTAAQRAAAAQLAADPPLPGSDAGVAHP